MMKSMERFRHPSRAFGNRRRRHPNPLAPAAVFSTAASHPVRSAHTADGRSDSLQAQDTRTEKKKTKGLRITDCRLRITDCRLRITDCRLRITDCRLRITDCRLRITDCRWWIAVNGNSWIRTANHAARRSKVHLRSSRDSLCLSWSS